MYEIGCRFFVLNTIKEDKELDKKTSVHFLRISDNNLKNWLPKLYNLNVINKYTNALDLLDDYDYQKIIKPTGDLKIIHKILEDSLNEVKYHRCEESN